MKKKLRNSFPSKRLLLLFSTKILKFSIPIRYVKHAPYILLDFGKTSRQFTFKRISLYVITIPTLNSSKWWGEICTKLERKKYNQCLRETLNPCPGNKASILWQEVTIKMLSESEFLMLQFKVTSLEFGLLSNR